ncbi:MAG: UDP-glucose/GDP-mannose dehydrogenase family protein [Bdellovibrionales bacterium]|nr:UDP-glucose/GDP-mannose dehydrogenase family protein [Bdellovibrionales bacterium]
MQISVVGTGYVGLVAGVCFADVGHKVICVDKDSGKIEALKKGQIPIYEPGLQDILKSAEERIQFTTDLTSAVNQSDVVFIAVGTPETADGSADLGPTFAVLEQICKAAQAPKYIVLKSTVPVGTNTRAKAFVAEHGAHAHEIINNPEFLKEGAAIDDFLRPDRVVIGCESHEAKNIMEKIYAPFISEGRPLLFMSNTSAELTKYAANSFLSVKISFANELAALADKVGANIDEVRAGFTSDSRINKAFFYPGVGYGGSCFPKDVQALIHTAHEHGCTMNIVEAADQVNDKQKIVLYQKVKERFKDLNGMTFALWGLAFKPRTDDVREAPAGYLIEKLTQDGAKVVAYDPVASETAKEAFPSPFEIANDPIAACQGADALLIATEWNEFRNPDYKALTAALKNPVIFDGRNCLEVHDVQRAGIEYFCIGKQSLFQGPA